MHRDRRMKDRGTEDNHGEECANQFLSFTALFATSISNMADQSSEVDLDSVIDRLLEGKPDPSESSIQYANH